jgi:hypothetical protein
MERLLKHEEGIDRSQKAEKLGVIVRKWGMHAGVLEVGSHVITREALSVLAPSLGPSACMQPVRLSEKLDCASFGGKLWSSSPPNP